MIADYLLANYDDVDLNGDGTISYVMFKGQNANPEAEYRTQYAVEDCDAALEAAGKPALTFYDANNADKFLSLIHIWRRGVQNPTAISALLFFQRRCGR